VVKRRIAPHSPLSNHPPGAAEPQVRDDILKAARGLIQRFGFRKTTMDDIARAMGKQRSSLYYYFPGKEAVVKALVDNELAEMSREVRKQVTSQTDAAGRLRKFLIARIEQMALRCKVFGQILPELFSGSDGAPDIFQLSEQRRAADETDQRYLAGIILQGIRDGQFRVVSKDEVNHFVHLVFSAMRGIELELVVAPETMENLKPRLEVAFNILLRGLLR